MNKKELGTQAVTAASDFRSQRGGRINIFYRTCCELIELTTELMRARNTAEMKLKLITDDSKLLMR